MFRRSKSESTEPDDTESSVKVGGKGRPTPTRKQAEAAARARARVPRTRREIAKQQRSTKMESSKTVRAAMKAGDERYLLPRDKGPVRRFIRDYVDTRFSIVELVIPLLLVTLVLGYTGNQALVSASSTIMFATVVLVLISVVSLRVRLRKELGRRFPDEPLKGTTYYAVTRSMQMKFMRIPKSKVKIGQELPDHYR